MKVLITGSTGFLGYRLSNYLNQNYEVYALNHKDLDVTDLDSVYGVLQKVKPEIVIHCAAISDRKTCEERSEDAYQLNVIGTINMAKACRECHARLIFCSSDQVYHESTRAGGHSELENLNPSLKYAQFKYEAEAAALDIHENTVALRLGAMYDACFDTKREHANLLTYILRDFKARNHMQYSANEYRGFTDVWEVIHNIPKVFDIPGGIYNFGSENTWNTYQLMRNIMKEIHREESLIEKSEQAIRNLCMDTTKIRKYGIEFQSTYDGLVNALQNAVNK